MKQKTEKIHVFCHAAPCPAFPSGLPSPPSFPLSFPPSFPLSFPPSFPPFLPPRAGRRPLPVWRALFFPVRPSPGVIGLCPASFSAVVKKMRFSVAPDRKLCYNIPAIHSASRPIVSENPAVKTRPAGRIAGILHLCKKYFTARSPLCCVLNI